MYINKFFIGVEFTKFLRLWKYKKLFTLSGSIKNPRYMGIIPIPIISKIETNKPKKIMLTNFNLSLKFRTIFKFDINFFINQYFGLSNYLANFKFKYLLM